MEETSKTVVKERIVTGFFLLLGFLSLLAAFIPDPAHKIQPQALLLAFLFTSAIILADHFPIYILRGTKLALLNLPIYLLAEGRGKQWDTKIVNAFVDMITRQIDGMQHATACQQDISHELSSLVSDIPQPSRPLHQFETLSQLGED